MTSRKRRAALAEMLGDELPVEYIDRAVYQLTRDVDEQRDFVHSEFLDRGAIREMIDGTRTPQEVARAMEMDFMAWLRRERQFRITTLAWALYAADHPTMRRK